MCSCAETQVSNAKTTPNDLLSQPEYVIKRLKIKRYHHFIKTQVLYKGGGAFRIMIDR